MKTIDFRGSNTKIAEHQAQYITLPAHVDSGSAGCVTTCWKAGFMERLKILFVGKIWLQVLTFKSPLQPLKMSTHRPIE